MTRVPAGQSTSMNSFSTGPDQAREEQPGAGEPEVTQVLDGNCARLTVVGELTEAARRPLIRVMTDLLLDQPALRRVELHVDQVSFMNSAGLAVLVQLQRLGAPRGIALALVAPPPAVAKPLRLSGLWHRFEVVDGAEPAPPQ